MEISEKLLEIATTTAKNLEMLERAGYKLRDWNLSVTRSEVELENREGSQWFITEEE